MKQSSCVTARQIVTKRINLLLAIYKFLVAGCMLGIFLQNLDRVVLYLAEFLRFMPEYLLEVGHDLLFSTC